MNLPGFTAEAALYEINEVYHTTLTHELYMQAAESPRKYKLKQT
jgi:hypothetical protein